MWFIKYYTVCVYCMRKLYALPRPHVPQFVPSWLSRGATGDIPVSCVLVRWWLVVEVQIPIAARPRTHQYALLAR